METVSKEFLEEVTCKTEKTFLDRFNPEHLEWTRLIGLELIKGNPLSTGELARQLQISTEKMNKIIETFHNIERDEKGRIVGLGGFTLQPTRHRCRMDGEEFYVWCAGDSLGFPVLLNKTMQIESVCYATEETINLTVTPHSVKHVSPGQAVVSVIVPDDLPKDIRGFYCNRVNYFKSHKLAEDWLSENKDGIILPVSEAFDHYRTMIKRIKKFNPPH